MCIQWIKDTWNKIFNPPVEPPPPPPPPPPDTRLMEVKENTAIFRSSGDNDSGLPIVDINTGLRALVGERYQFYYPWAEADGSLTYCEIYRSIDGMVWKRGCYINRDKLKKIY